MNRPRVPGSERAADAARRWRDHAAERGARLQAVRRGHYTEADTPERIRLRAHRLARWGVAVGGSRPDGQVPDIAVEALAGTADGVLPSDEFLERLIGATNDLLSVEFFELGSAAAQSVGRIVTGGRPNGTGFLVAPGLLITNHHVLRHAGDATDSTLELDYEDNRVGVPKGVETVRLRPDEFFLADEALDFALVGVADKSDAGTPVSGYGTLPLIGDEGKARIGEPVDVVQHPGGRVKQIVLRNSTLLDLPGDDGNRYLHYDADTEGGSSGSPVFNDQWEVVALHHSGVPKTDAQGRPVDAQGQVLPRGADESRYIWVANEGIRISRIVEAVGAAELPEPMARRRDEVLATWQTRGRPEALARRAAPAPPPTTTPSPTVVREQVPAPPAAGRPDREGYDPRFLGTELPFPVLVDLRHGPDGSGELRYHHYSVLMNARRRLAYVSAVNIDVNAPFHQDREGSDTWSFDPRLSAALQAGKEFYDDNPLDRGHLARRDDAAWGGTEEEAQLASDDTFHWTNCAPQHEIYNRPNLASQRGLMLWGGLEMAVTRLARGHGGRLSVFNGPVFADDDPPYRQGFWLPRAFWKVIAVPDGDVVRALGFRLEQAEQLADIGREAFAPDELAGYVTAQVPVREIEAQTGLDLGPLAEQDVLPAAPESVGRPVLRSEADIVLG